jgi:anti-sigma factor RsiW
MHAVIQNGLEDFLGGLKRREFEAHLEECAECRAEVREFQELSTLFEVMREPETVVAAPGFYFRLTENLEAQKKPSFWSLFSLDNAFGRRVAFGSLLTLTLVGGILISQETAAREPGGADNPIAPVVIMASHDFATEHESGADRDRMMVTLASYEQ